MTLTTAAFGLFVVVWLSLFSHYWTLRYLHWAHPFLCFLTSHLCVIFLTSLPFTRPATFLSLPIPISPDTYFAVSFLSCFADCNMRSVILSHDFHPLYKPEMYQFSVSEGAAVGTAVGRVIATDADMGENTDMTYLIKDGGELFKVTTDVETQEAVVSIKKVQLSKTNRLCLCFNKGIAFYGNCPTFHKHVWDVQSMECTLALAEETSNKESWKYSRLQIGSKRVFANHLSSVRE